MSSDNMNKDIKKLWTDEWVSHEGLKIKKQLRSDKMDKKYYFISYRWTRDNINGWEYSNRVADKHPIYWLKEMIDDFNDTYQIEFYDEITKEQYELINGWID